MLHPWWRGPMALVLATWRELERRTAATVQCLLSVRQHLTSPSQLKRRNTDVGGVGPQAGEPDPGAIARAFDTVLRALEERRESRSRWDSRFADPAYRSLPSDCAPVVPGLWLRSETAGDVRNWEGEGPLPKELSGIILRLRECYTETYRAACGGKKADSAKAIAAGAASNWELFRAASSKEQNGAEQQQSLACAGGRGGKRSAGVGGDRRTKHCKIGFIDGVQPGAGGRGRGRKGKGSKNRA